MNSKLVQENGNRYGWLIILKAPI